MSSMRNDEPSDARPPRQEEPPTRPNRAGIDECIEPQLELADTPAR
jgi:hypothetical protein